MLPDSHRGVGQPGCRLEGSPSRRFALLEGKSFWKVPAGSGTEIGGALRHLVERPDAYQAQPTYKAVLARVPPPSGTSVSSIAVEYYLLEIAKGLV